MFTASYEETFVTCVSVTIMVELPAVVEKLAFGASDKYCGVMLLK
jgi:hypothetical protein